MAEENVIPQNIEKPVEVKEYAPGEILTGKVTGITSFGAFVRLPDGKEGLVHISEIANTYVTNVENFLKLDQDVTIKVLGKNQKGKFDLSIKQVPRESGGPAPMPTTAQTFAPRGGAAGGRGRGGDKNFAPGSFDEMMHSFMKTSEEVQLDVRRNIQYRQGSKKKGKKKGREE